MIAHHHTIVCRSRPLNIVQVKSAIGLAREKHPIFQPLIGERQVPERDDVAPRTALGEDGHDAVLDRSGPGQELARCLERAAARDHVVDDGDALAAKASGVAR